MRKSNVFITLFLLSLTGVKPVCTGEVQANDEDYIDPNDLFNFDPINMRMKKESYEVTANKVPQPGDALKELPTTSSPPKDQSVYVTKEIFTQNTESCSADKKLNTIAVSLLRQYVMILVNNLEKKDIPNTHADINLRLRVSRHDIYKLKQFGQEKTTDIRDIHEILRYIIQYDSNVLPQESNLHWLESRMGLSWPMMLQILATMIGFIALLRALRQTLFTQRLIFQMLCLFFLISVIFAWLEMYQEKLADRDREFMETLGKACAKPEDLSFFNRAFLFVTSKFTFKNDKCEEYYQKMFVSPILKVSPMEAFSVAVVKTLVAPIGIIGKAISTFLTELLKDLPVHYQFAVSLVLPVLLVIFLCIWRGYQLNLFHLVSIGPGHQPAPIPIGTRPQSDLMPIEPRHQSAPFQMRQPVAPVNVRVPASSQVRQIERGSLHSVHERVPQLSAANMDSLNASQRVTKQHIQLQQSSQVHAQEDVGPTEMDPVAGGDPCHRQLSCKLRDNDHEDIRQMLAEVKITTQDVDIKQVVHIEQEFGIEPDFELGRRAVENQLQKLIICEYQPMPNDASNREMDADEVVKESDDIKQSTKETSMTNVLQEEQKSSDESAPHTLDSTLDENVDISVDDR